jgi:3-hydroxyisobutyrate dehydrogenase
MTVGFAGIGTMGSAIATNLLRAGIPLVVWNRSPEKCDPLIAMGATGADSIDALCAACPVILVMLLDEAAIDNVLGRGTPAFARRMHQRTLLLLGTTSAEYSQQLECELIDCGARYVEAPVSGSRGPAERGELVGMLAGRDEAAIEAARSLLAASCRQVFGCGGVPGALRMKLAVNHYLVATVAALAETVHAARCAGLDVALLRDILDAGPMASAVSRAKLDLLVRDDFTPQAGIRDVATIAALVATQARRCGAQTPLIDACAGLYRRALEQGGGERDMIAVVSAFDRLATWQDGD